MFTQPCVHSALCSLSPMFTQPCVHSALCSSRSHVPLPSRPSPSAPPPPPPPPPNRHVPPPVPHPHHHPSTSTKTVIPHLDMIFSRHGIPDVVKTDNGPPFNGNQFQTFSKDFGFHHRKITPLWPEANGEAERFMATLNKYVRAATAENSHWKNQLPQFLRHYRATPHSSTHVSPFEAPAHRPENASRSP